MTADPAPRHEEKDVFISYCREDNRADASGRRWVSAVVEQLKRCHAEFCPGEELKIFIDEDDIAPAENWRARLLHGLRHSRFLIAFLSENYTDPSHPNCAWEWDTFERFERQRGLYGEAIAPIFFVVKPDGPARAAAEQQVRRWLDHRRWRNDLKLGESSWRSVDEQLVPLEPTGLAILETDAVRRKLAALDAEIVRKRELAKQVAASPSRTVPTHNPNFAGRDRELQLLRRTLLERPAVVTAGLGGVGKTALACEYSHVFAHAYPGGRYWLPADGKTDLGEVLLQLGGTGSPEQYDSKLAWEPTTSLEDRVRLVQHWLQAPQPRPGLKLLILDNVDSAALLDRADEFFSPDAPVHVLATSRGELRGAVAFPLDELSEDEAVEVVRRHCHQDDDKPGINPKRSLSDADLAIVREIVRDLNGFTLAVEAVAVHLAARPEVSLAGFRDLLRAGGVAALDRTAAKDHVKLKLHREKLLSLTLEPTLATLSPVELDVLHWAVTLPPDSVPLAWLRDWAAQSFPSLGEPPPAGREDEDVWMLALHRLEATRLLVPDRAGFRPHERPHVARYHRMVGDVVRLRAAFPSDYTKHSWDKVGLLIQNLDKRVHQPEVRAWMEPLRQFLGSKTNPRGHSGVWAWHANSLAMVEQSLGNFLDARELLLKAIAIQEAASDQTPTALANSYSNLATVERDLGNFHKARELLLKAIPIQEAAYKPTHPALALSNSRLAMVERALGNLSKARELLLKVIAIEAMVYGPTDPRWAVRYYDLALVERDLGNFSQARELLLKAIAIEEVSCPPTHHTRALSYSNLATVEHSLGNFAKARELLIKAIAIQEAAYAPTHPALAASYSNLALVEQALGNLHKARELMLKAIAINERTYKLNHSILGTCYSNLAIIEKAVGNFPQARELLLKAIVIFEAAYDPRHPTLANSYSLLAVVEKEFGNISKARALMTRARDIWRSRNHPMAEKADRWLDDNREPGA